LGEEGDEEDDEEGDRNLLFNIERKRRIEETVAAKGVSRPTVVTAIMRYWQRGIPLLRAETPRSPGPSQGDTSALRVMSGLHQFWALSGLADERTLLSSKGGLRAIVERTLFLLLFLAAL
jgi:hypothetical protein